MPTSREDQEFAKEIESHATAEVSISSSALDTAISWISNHLSPDEVFDVKDLNDWAESNGFVKE